MEHEWTLSGAGDELLRLTYRRDATSAAVTVSPVLTVTDVCHRVGKSRRQVYRDLQAGRLRPCTQILGQWLISKAEVDRLAKSRLPACLKRFFWDVPFSSVSVDAHGDFILARLLEEGDRSALRWLFRVYPRNRVVNFLKGRGAAVLSKRAWQFWASQLGLNAKERRGSSWRLRGRASLAAARDFSARIPRP